MDFYALFLDALWDTWSVLPLLFVIYIWLEALEKVEFLEKLFVYLLQKHGPLLGATLGLLPQCGFSVAAVVLYAKDEITWGTLLSVFIAVSDEALPVLLSEPSAYPALFWMLFIKWVLAFSIGSIFNAFTHKELKTPELSKDASSFQWNRKNLWEIVQTAAWKTLKIYLLVFSATFILSSLISLIGIDRVSSILLEGSLWQPVLTAILGLIPNCSVSIVFCQLFILNELSFASLCSGLISNAGLGMLVFAIRYKNKTRVFYTVLILLSVAIVTGLVLSFIPILQ